MISKKNFLIAILPIFLLSGCTSIGNVIITPHPNSLRIADEKITLYKITEEECLPRPEGEKERERALKEAQERLGYVIGAETVIGVAVAGVVKVLEEETKQYSASYSATKSADLNDFDCINFSSIRKKGEDGEKILTNLNVYLNKQDPALRLKVDRLQLSGFRSKIAAWPFVTLIKGSNPWSGDSLSSKIGNTVGWVNPLMILHAVYSLFDWDTYSVEAQVKIRIDSVVTVGNQRSLVNFGSVELPSEKYSIFDLKQINLNTPINSKKPKPFETGFLALPKGVKLPTNFFVTIVEDNDFGNIVGKGAKQVGNAKDSIIDIF